jgi:hypothetical protein
MRVLMPVLANAVLFVAALSLGSLLRRLIPESFSRIDRVAVILLAGLGLLGTLLFCIGQVRFSRWAILLTLCFSILLGARSLFREVGDYRASVAKVSLPVLPVLLVASVLLVTAIGGLSEPTGDMNNDTIAYHYYGPAVWLRQGIIRAVPDEVLTYFPVVVEAQYAALMSIGGKRAPGLFAVVGLTALLLTAAGLGIRLGLDSSGAWWAAALIAAMPAVYRGAFGGFLDALFAAFVLAAARIAFDAERAEHYVLFGIFCGISMGTKYTGIVACAVLIFCAFCLFVWGYRRKPKTAVLALAISCATAIVIACPFYLRNWILYGCPIYPPPPALLHVFRATNISPRILQELLKNVRETGAGMGGGLAHLLLLPFNLTYHTANFRGAGGIGLVPWALAPFGVLARRRDVFAKGLVLFASLELVCWFLTAQVSRYLIVVYVIAAIFGVLGWRYVEGLTTRYGRALCSLVVGISILYGLFMIVSDRVEDLHAAMSSSFEEQRRYRDTLWVESFDYINRDPSVKKVLILDENVGPYFIKKDYIKPFGRWGEQTVPGATNLSQLMALLPSLHVTHVLDVRFEGGPFKLSEHPAGLTPVFERRNQVVYKTNFN